MTPRVTGYVVTRPKVLFPALFGFGLLLGNVSMFWGVVLLGFAAYKASKLLSHADLDDRLRLKMDKIRHGIRRMLTDGERKEVLAIDRYCQSLKTAGADPELTSEVMEQAWDAVSNAGPEDASSKLQELRYRLPRLTEPADSPTSRLSDRLARELQIVHATQKEMESLG